MNVLILFIDIRFVIIRVVLYIIYAFVYLRQLKGKRLKEIEILYCYAKLLPLFI